MNCNQNEGKLVRDFLNGDEKSFDIIYKENARKVYSILLRMLKDEYLAEDVLQEVFVKVYKSLKGFNFKSSLYTWIYRIAVNTALTSLEKDKKNSSNQNLHEYEDTLTGEQKENDGFLIKERIEKAIGTLPEKQKIVFNLRFYEKLRFKEISKVLKISENSAKVNFNYAINKVKVLLEDLL